MKSQRLPSRVSQFAASELLHGDIDGFIINAYLAIQRQWPDEGGFRHYHYLLVRHPEVRARVLRELAGSPSAIRLGTDLVDDLPPDHVFDPAANDAAHYQQTTQRLQLLHLIHDTSDLREAISRITLEGISEAVQLVVETAMASLAQMDSRIASAEAEIAALRQRLSGAAQPGDPTAAAAPAKPADQGTVQDSELAWLRHEVLRLGRRVQLLEHAPPTGGVATAPTAPQAEAAPEGALGAAVARLDAELAELRHVLMPLHQFTTVDLKRHLADYVNALVTAHASAAAFDPPGFPAAPAQKRVPDGL